MTTHVVILGAGFGGLELATRLSEEVPDQVRVTLIDQSEWFMFGFSKLDVMFGRKTAEDVRLYYRDIAKPSVEFRHERIVSIDPATRTVVTDQNTYDADLLVVALGADLDPAATAGLAEGGFEFYTPAGAEIAKDAIASFEGGAVLISVLGGFFKCPPAPFETALMLHDFLSERGVRDASSIHVTSPLPMPIPISKPVSDEIISALTERDIQCSFQTLVTHLDPAEKIAHLADGRTMPYDLFLAIPIHRAPAVVAASGLCVDGWIPIDIQTFETRFPGVFAVGDVTSAPVPRAGVMAEGEARTLADVLIARVSGDDTPPAPFEGAVTCYMEFGDDSVARVNVNFLSGPQPTAEFLAASAEGTRLKQEFGATRRRRWFGR